MRHLLWTPSKRFVATITTIAAISAVALAGCSASGGSTAAGSQSATSTTKRTLTIFAAASLAKPLAPIIKSFEQAHPGLTIKSSYAGSSTLVTQIEQGAPADLMLSADSANMDKLATADALATTPTYFARNALTIVTPPDNPSGIKSIDDLDNKGVRVVVCSAPVPCGAATTTLEKNADLKIKPVSQENAVTDVLAKVRSGNADAGIVYVSDAKGAGDAVHTVKIPSDVNVINDYPAAVVKQASNSTDARAFIAYLTLPATQKALRADGFLAPKQ